MSVVIGFATLDPNTGSGDATVTVTGETYYGREQRSVTAQVAAGSLTQNVVINQAGRDEYVNIESTKAVDKEGGTVTITGTTNSSSLTFTTSGTGDNSLTITLPDNYTAGGVSTTNGAEIADDPGASGEVSFSITITVGENETVTEKTATITVQAAGGQTSSCAVTQAAGDATLEVDPTTINLDADGTAQQFTINSNTNWTISQVAGKIRKLLNSLRK